MAIVTLPYTLTPGTPENVNNLTANLNALRDGVNVIDTAQLNTNAVTTAKITDKAVTGAKLGAAPYAELRRLTNFSLADNSFVTPTGSQWTGAAFDNGVATTGTALASTSAGTITLRRAGMWMITGSVTWGVGMTGWRSVAIYWSDIIGAPAAQDVNSQGFGSFFNFTSTVSTVVMATSATSTISLQLYQNNGGAMTVNPFYLRAVWLGNNT